MEHHVCFIAPQLHATAVIRYADTHRQTQTVTHSHTYTHAHTHVRRQLCFCRFPHGKVTACCPRFAAAAMRLLPVSDAAAQVLHAWVTVACDNGLAQRWCPTSGSVYDTAAVRAWAWVETLWSRARDPSTPSWVWQVASCCASQVGYSVQASHSRLFVFVCLFVCLFYCFTAHAKSA